MNRVTLIKIEILIDAPLVRRFRDIALENGMSSFTLLPVAGGGNESGRWTDDQVTGGAGSKMLFVTHMNEADAEKFLSGIQPVLNEFDLEVTLIKAEAFRNSRQ